ncbi:MAG TPA: hydroxypyruvate isomerase [Rhodospirillales bacterium]|nr:hydroxypyruvate isomerase [Rhodospirillales bacterium]
MPRFCANLSMLYGERDFLDRFAAAATDGFRGVEYLFPYAYPAEILAARLEENGLEQVLFNLPAGDWEAGERGIACLPDRVEEFRRGVEKAIAYARTLGCRQLNCLAGIAPPDADPARLEAVLVDNLAFAARALADAGIRLLLEPINTRDVPGFFLSRTDQALRILEAVGSDNLYLQYDFYHMQIMQGDLTPTFDRLQHRIAHVQIADHPGRHEPGTGEIAYDFVFGHLDARGYAGWVGCEYKPLGDTRAGLGWLSRWRTNGANGG